MYIDNERFIMITMLCLDTYNILSEFIACYLTRQTWQAKTD